MPLRNRPGMERFHPSTRTLHLVLLLERQRLARRQLLEFRAGHPFVVFLAIRRASVGAVEMRQSAEGWDENSGRGRLTATCSCLRREE